MAIRDTFRVVRGRHIKVFLSMKDDNGNVKKLKFLFSGSPSSSNWIKTHIQQVKMKLRENNISITV